MAGTAAPLSTTDATIQRFYDEGRAAANRGDLQGAINHFIASVNAASVTTTDVWVRGDTGRRAAYNLGLLTSQRGLLQAQAAKVLVQNGTAVGPDAPPVQSARSDLSLAAQAFDAARSNERGEPLVTPDAHVRRAAVGIARASLDAVTGVPGTVTIRMVDREPVVDNEQLRELDTARAALTTAERVGPSATGIEAVPNLSAQLATWRSHEGLQRVQSVGALAAGAIAALSDATNTDAPPATVTAGAATTLASVSAYARAIRGALRIRGLGPNPNAAQLRASLGGAEDHLAWNRMWIRYFDRQVASVPGHDAEKNEVRRVLVTLGENLGR